MKSKEIKAKLNKLNLTYSELVYKTIKHYNDFYNADLALIGIRIDNFLLWIHTQELVTNFNLNRILKKLFKNQGFRKSILNNDTKEIDIAKEIISKYR